MTRISLFALCFLSLALLFPFAPALAQTGNGMPEETSLILCNKDLMENGQFSDPCNFSHFIQLGKHIINLAIYLAVPLAALSFAWAGFKILTAGGNMGQREEGKEIFVKVAKGLFWVLIAWLLVNTILTALLLPGYSLLE